ncbi:hypothetical protein PHJA_000205200 [Phtheirospermum japonicum]|uniref:Fungal lipase-type domain-containing protein n=1 Tax=Phtheirospermum japonicum TaxID=374723 RepID=A0A830B5M3_9LAMI|nr:hypothetical protein PHJA_000205200 [Phtheirospermum japonicum]
MDALCLKAGIHGMAAPSAAAAADNPSAAAAPPRNLPWGFTFRHPLRSLWPGSKIRHEPAISVNEAVLAEEKDGIKEIDDERTNWNFNILHLNPIRKEEVKDGELEKETRVKSEEIEGAVEEKGNCRGANEECDVCAIDDDDNIKFDRESFSKLLQKVSLAEARLYAQLSYLGCLAYSIPQIKPENLLRHHGLQFVTSSLEKKEKVSSEDQQKGESNESDNNKAQNAELESKPELGDSRLTAYQIAASAASYVHSHTRSILRFNSSKSTDNENACEDISDVASLMATGTEVVAAKEEVKQAVADDLNSNVSSPCEWFVCDDDRTTTRFFVIQGLDVLVHRGIYEAAKGMYKQMLPEIHAHLKSHGDRATFRFTGHSLGGSLSVLVNLMLLIRGEAPRSSLLLPVITYGAPSIMCGGDRLLRDLGLPRDHVRSITMHRDIVPRAFSCNYPNRVAELLKAVNGKFRNHPCLNKQLLILQPDDTFSPSHDLLPPGGGLYLLTGPATDIAKSANKIRAAQAVFLNSPHPLEILSDRSAYGSEGNIQRDHDMSSYLKSVRNVIRQELNRMRKARRDHRRRVLWPLVGPTGVNGGGVVVSRRANMMMGRGRFDFSGMVRTGRASLKRFSTLVASQHMHLVVVVLGTYCSFIDFDFA